VLLTGLAKWESAANNSTAVVTELRRLVTEEFPPDIVAALAIPDTDGRLVRRRPVQWLDLCGRFDAVNGRVALVGDAAHAMTPDLGEGVNCALESAVALDEELGARVRPSDGELLAAFRRYGASRPAVTRGVMQRSVDAAKAKTGRPGGPTQAQAW
jgi:2-polyprenyl-6-methoxyphenol hydroxylase-like FAD-dependent oxidoreductase